MILFLLCKLLKIVSNIINCSSEAKHVVEWLFVDGVSFHWKIKGRYHGMLELMVFSLSKRAQLKKGKLKDCYFWPFLLILTYIHFLWNLRKFSSRLFCYFYSSMFRDNIYADFPIERLLYRTVALNFI